MGTDELYLYLEKIGDNLNYKSLKCMWGFFAYLFVITMLYSWTNVAHCIQ